jgi:hypothetical protein
MSSQAFGRARPRVGRGVGIEVVKERPAVGERAIDQLAGV